MASAVHVASAVRVARASAWWALRPQRPWQGCERQVVDGEVNQWRARPWSATGRVEVQCASLARQASTLQERRGRCGGCSEGRLQSRGITASGVAVAAGSIYIIFVSDWEGWDKEAANGGRHRHRNHTHTTSKLSLSTPARCNRGHSPSWTRPTLSRNHTPPAPPDHTVV